MRHLSKMAAFIVLLLMIAVSCEKDAFSPGPPEGDAAAEVDFRNRATLPPLVLNAIPMVEDFKDEVTMLMLQRKLPAVNGNDINRRVESIIQLLNQSFEEDDLDRVLDNLYELNGYLHDCHSTGGLTDEVYDQLHASLLAIILPLDPYDAGTVMGPWGDIYQWRRMPDGKKWLVENMRYKTHYYHWLYPEELYPAHIPYNPDLCGRLYPWISAFQACGALPDGWRLPNDEEWEALIRSFDPDFDTMTPSVVAYEALIKGGDSGFDALLGGLRFATLNPGLYDDFGLLDEAGFYWSADERDDEVARSIAFRRESPYEWGVWRYDAKKTACFSCRCVLD